MIKFLAVVMTRRATKFRPHRGAYADAMREVTTIHSKKELRKYILENWGEFYKHDGKLTISKYGYDPRNQWDTYIVQWDGSVVGFTSGPLN